MPKVLITGGCGFIGSNLVEYLLKNTSWQIVVLDNFSTGNLGYIDKLPGYAQRCKLVKGDVRKKIDIDTAMVGCDYVVHLAAQIEVIDSIKNPLNDAEINIMGTINVLSASVTNKIKKFVLASSAAPLGDQKMPMDETKVPEPMSPYGASKLAAEGYCSAYSGCHGLNCVVLRFTNVYGPKSDHSKNVITLFIKRIMNTENITLYGDGDQTRDFIHVYDVCKGIYLGLTKSGLTTHELIQLGTGRETSMNELYNKLKSIFASQTKGYKFIDAYHAAERKGEIRRNFADISKAKKLLGFRPEIAFDQGLRQTVEWFFRDVGPDKQYDEEWN
ncbi:MAG: GDP-mannose 4,6-dehydratase [archaeon]